MTTPTDERQFVVSHSFLNKTRWAAYVLFGFGVAIQLVWLFEPPMNVEFGAVFFSLGSLFFLVLGGYALRIVRNAPHYAIAVNDDGIRYLHARPGKEALRWADVIEVRESPRSQSLELKSLQGLSLRVEYQLENFDELRAIILSHLKSSNTFSLPFTHKRSSLYHLLYGALIFLSVGAAYYFFAMSSAGEREMYAGIGLVVFCGIICHEYWTQVVAIDVSSREIVLKFPFRSVDVDVNRISSIEINDDFAKQSRIPFVIINLVSGRSYPLKNVGIDAIKLAAILKMACGRTAG